MPDTIVRPGNHNGDAYAARNKLGVAIAALAEERERHDHLVAAQDRAHHDLQAVHGSLLNAQDALTKARRAKPQELAYAYASGSETLQLRHSVAEADALVKRRKDELEHLQEIDRALTAEIEQVEVRLRNCQSAVHEALSRVVAASTEFGSFCDELDKTWLRLRSLKVAADNIMVACHGNLPTEVYRRLQAAQPLEERVGYPVEDIVARWQGALARLLTSADTALPEGA